MSPTNSIALLRLAALVEGISFLALLGIAMPLKYFAGLPQAVKVAGWVHGVLFMMLCAALAYVTVVARWPAVRAAAVFLAALLPFGPFVLDCRMKQYEREFRGRTAG